MPRASLGEKVKVKLNNKEKMIGILEDFKDNTLFLHVDDKKVTIPLGDIEKARTYFEW